MKYQGNSDFDHKTSPKIGILLVNLGTPDEPTTAATRRYLKEFLSDPRVVEVPRLVWWLVLNLVILNIRPSRSAKLYQSIWMKEGSPLMHFSQSLTEKVRHQILQKIGTEEKDAVMVECAMRYGNPSIHSALEKMRQKNLRYLYIIPMYPQYSGSTTGSIFDAVSDVIKKWRVVPEINFLQSYHDTPEFIETCCKHLEGYWNKNGKPEKVFFSYHGVPLRYLHAGDPYHCQCHKTTRLIAEKMQLEPKFYQTIFQSRFGREAWLKPYTDHTLEEQAKSGLTSTQIFCPGFAVDCLETLEEIAMEAKASFLKAGGKKFEYIPALNDTDLHANFFVNSSWEVISKWLEKLPDQKVLEHQATAAEKLPHNQKKSDSEEE